MIELGYLANFKMILSDPSSGKSSSHELKDEQAQALLGTRIGDELDGSILGISSKIRITGGSDTAGFPMRKDLLGGVKKWILLTRGVGFHTDRPGDKRRKLIRGNTITEEIYQINACIVNQSG